MMTVMMFLLINDFQFESEQEKRELIMFVIILDLITAMGGYYLRGLIG